MEVSTRSYEMSHGKRPRGQGHWAFFFDGQDEIDHAFWFTGMYRDAVKQAKAFARAKGHHRIEVGS